MGHGMADHVVIYSGRISKEIQQLIPALKIMPESVSVELAQRIITELHPKVMAFGASDWKPDIIKLAKDSGADLYVDRQGSDGMDQPITRRAGRRRLMQAQTGSRRTGQANWSNICARRATNRIDRPAPRTPLTNDRGICLRRLVGDLSGCRQLRAIPASAEGRDQLDGSYHFRDLRGDQCLLVTEERGLRDYHVEIGIDAGLVAAELELEGDFGGVDGLLQLDHLLRLDAHGREKILYLLEGGERGCPGSRQPRRCMSR